MQKGKINGLKGAPVGTKSPAGVAGSVRASPRKAALKFSAIDMLRAGGQLVGTMRKKDSESPKEPPKSTKKTIAKTKMPKVTLQQESRKKHKGESKESTTRQTESRDKTATDSSQDDARKFKFGKLKKYEESLEKKRLSGSEKLEAGGDVPSLGLKKQAVTEIKKQWSLRRKPKITEDSGGGSEKRKAVSKPSRLQLKRQQLRVERRDRRRASTDKTTPSQEKVRDDVPIKRAAKKLKKPALKVRVTPRASNSMSPEKDRVHDNIFSSLASLSDDSRAQDSSGSADHGMPVLEKANKCDDPSLGDAGGTDDDESVSDEGAESQNFRIIRGRRGSSDSSCSDASLTMMVGPHRKTYGPDASPRHGWTSTSDNKSKHFDELLGRTPASSCSSRRTSLESEEEEGASQMRVSRKPDPETQEEELEEFELEVEDESGDLQAALQSKVPMEKSSLLPEKPSECGPNDDLIPGGTVPPPNLVTVASPPEIGEVPAVQPDEPKTLPPLADELEESIHSTEEEDVVQEHATVAQTDEHLAENEDFVLEVPVSPESQTDTDTAAVPRQQVVVVEGEGGQDNSEKVEVNNAGQPGDGEAQGESSQKESKSESDPPPEEQTEETTGASASDEPLIQPAAEQPLEAPVGDAEEKVAADSPEGEVLELGDGTETTEDLEATKGADTEAKMVVEFHEEEGDNEERKESIPVDETGTEEAEQSEGMEEKISETLPSGKTTVSAEAALEEEHKEGSEKSSEAVKQVEEEEDVKEMEKKKVRSSSTTG